eukprot:COSAG06_NODE_1391_length_9606_cov_54.546229_5_plen_77_part_00
METTTGRQLLVTASLSRLSSPAKGAIEIVRLLRRLRFGICPCLPARMQGQNFAPGMPAIGVQPPPMKQMARLVAET